MGYHKWNATNFLAFYGNIKKYLRFFDWFIVEASMLPCAAIKKGLPKPSLKISAYQIT